MELLNVGYLILYVLNNAADAIHLRLNLHFNIHLKQFNIFNILFEACVDGVRWQCGLQMVHLVHGCHNAFSIRRQRRQFRQIILKELLHLSDLLGHAIDKLSSLHICWIQNLSLVLQ